MTSRKRSLSRKLGKRVLRGPDRTRYLNALIVDLTHKTEAELEYWRAFQNYLVNERETRKDRIQESLRSQAVTGYENDQLVRIVDSRYQNGLAIM